jgi:hypothetical protein
LNVPPFTLAFYSLQKEGTWETKIMILLLPSKSELSLAEWLKQ